MTTAREKPVSYECRHVTHVVSMHDSDDAHFIKEIQHFADGRTEPYLRRIDNYQRDFFITKPAFQNHKSKKEYEDLDKLMRFKTTERNKKRSVAKALGMPWFNGGLKELSNNPYLYGSDISSMALIKKAYQDKYPDKNTPYSVAIFDTETDVVRNPKIKEVVMASLTMKNRAVTAVSSQFLKNGKADIDEIRAIASKEIKDILTQRDLDWEIVIFDREIDIVRHVMKRAHEWKPDLVACWNMLFDIRRVEEACQRADVDPAELLCDPNIPKKYRHYEIIEGLSKRVTASGVKKPFKPSERWHTVVAAASFQWVCSMCAYRQIRTGRQEEPSYALDAILNKVLKRGKLSMGLCEDASGLEWHVQMQKRHPCHYVVYNLFDCVGCELLDEATYDLSVTLGLYSGPSDFSRFNSQPKRKVDELHFFLLSTRKQVIATCGKNMDDGFDHLVVPLSGWITMLYPHLVVSNGVRCIEENPLQATTIHPGTSDLDVSAAYPTNQAVANACKATTVYELVSIEDVPMGLVKMNTINFSSGATNAVEFCTDIFGMPLLAEMDMAYQAHKRGETYVRQPRGANLDYLDILANEREASKEQEEFA